MAKRTGLGRGIGALIPTSETSSEARPVDVFFPGAPIEDSDVMEELLEVPGARLAEIDPDLPAAERVRLALRRCGVRRGPRIQRRRRAGQ